MMVIIVISVVSERESECSRAIIRTKELRMQKKNAAKATWPKLARFRALPPSLPPAQGSCAYPQITISVNGKFYASFLCGNP